MKSIDTTAASNGKAPSYEALLIIAQSVCGALSRAGVTDCDDPGEAIDVMREKYEERLANLSVSKPDSAAPGGDVDQLFKLAARWESLAEQFYKQGSVISKVEAASMRNDARELREVIAALSAPKQAGAEDDALYRMFRAIVDAGGPSTIARHGVERGGDEWASAVRAGLLAIEHRFHPERFDYDFSPQPAPQPVEADGREAVPLGWVDIEDIDTLKNDDSIEDVPLYWEEGEGRTPVYTTPPPEQPAIELERPQYAAPWQECYSIDGDFWRDCPDDCDFVEDMSLGDTFELMVSHYSVQRTYRVTKVPDEESDDYEVEPVPIIDGAKGGQ